MSNQVVRFCFAALILAACPMLVHAKGPAVAGAKIEARLTATAATRLASGKAKYEVKGSLTKFSVEGEDLGASFNGQSATVSVNGAAVGSARVAAGGFDLNLSSSSGGSLPSIKAGDVVSVSVGGVGVLNGKF